MVAARVVVTKDAVDALPPEPEHAGVIQVTASSAAKIQEHPRLSMYVIIGWTGDGCKFGLTAIGRKRLSWAEGVRNGQIRSCFAKFRIPIRKPNAPTQRAIGAKIWGRRLTRKSSIQTTSLPVALGLTVKLAEPNSSGPCFSTSQSPLKVDSSHAQRVTVILSGNASGPNPVVAVKDAPTAVGLPAL